MVELSDTQIQDLLRDYLKNALKKDELGRVPAEKDWSDGQELDTHVDAVTHLQDDCYRELAIRNYSRATGAVDRLLAEKGIRLDQDGASYHKLCQEMMKVMINLLEIDMRRSRCDYSLEDLPFPEFSASPRSNGQHHKN